MRIASKKHSQNVNARGNVPKSLAVSDLFIHTVNPLRTHSKLNTHVSCGFLVLFQKSDEDKSPVGPYLLAFFVFVVCGSGVCTCIRTLVCVFIVGSWRVN